MGNWLEKNLEMMKKGNPELSSRMEGWKVSSTFEVVYARNGLPVTRAGNITFHSLVDPEKEARAWVEKEVVREKIHRSKRIAVLGFGTGYHVRALLHATDGSIRVLEPSMDILRLAFEAVDLSALLPRISWAVGLEEMSPEDSVPLLQHRPSMRFYKTHFPQWVEKMVRRETMEDLKVAFRHDEAIFRFLDGFPPNDPADLKLINSRIREGRKPLPPWQTMFLLIEEFETQGFNRLRVLGSKGKNENER
jgi:hypothetical protein